MKNKQKKQGKKSLFDNRRFLLAAAIGLGFFAWVVVAGFIDPATDKTIPQVPIDYTRNELLYKERNLQIVSELKDVYADVKVNGDGALIGPLSYTSVTVYPDYTSVTEPGTHEVPLRASRVEAGSYTISNWSTITDGHSLDRPKQTVTITFEETATKNFIVNVRADGVTAAAGYYRETPSAGSVDIFGPKSAVERISQVVAEVTVDEELSERKKYMGVPLKLLDVNGNELDAEELGLELEPETVEVDIPILEIRTIKLGVNFLGLPDGYDVSWLQERTHLSVDSVQVVGSSAAFETLSGVLYIDVDATQLALNWESDPLNITLPADSGLRFDDEQRQVTITFDSTGMTEKTFEIPAADFEVRNGPANAEISPITDTVTVKLLGPEEEVNALLAEHISVQIDAYGISATRGGQQPIPARIVVAGAGHAIPLGSYSILCDVELSSS